MINLIKYDKALLKIHYSSSFDEVITVRINLYDNYTNSLVTTNVQVLTPNLTYWTAYSSIRKDCTIKFINYETSKVISTYSIEGDKEIEDGDINGYFNKIQSLNTNEQQISLNKLLDESFNKLKNESVKVEEGDVVVDVGFGYGLFSLDAVKKGASQVYGFEPNKTLSQKLSIFPHSGKARIYNCGISNVKKTKKFYEDANSLNSSFTSTDVNVSKSYNVDCLRLEDIMKEESVKKIDFLNFDCVGDEYDIINDISDSFFDKVNKIRITYYNNVNNKIDLIIDKLKRNHFSVTFDVSPTKTHGVLFAKKTYNNIVLISSYCDNQEKKDVLLKNLKLLRDAGLDTAVISPLPLPEEIVSATDYFFQTKENIVLSWPTHAMYEWMSFAINKKQYVLTTMYDDYGFSGLQHVKRLGEMFLNYDYDFYNYIIYDTVIDDYVLNFLKTGHRKMVFPSQRGEKTWGVGLHLMSFDKENLKKVLEKITLENYLSYKDFDAFAFLHNHIVIPLDIAIGDRYVKDWIFYYDNDNDKMNFSEIASLKYFFMSEESDREMSILFYGTKEVFDVVIKINDTEKEYRIKNLDFINLGITKNEFKKGSIVINGKEYDLTKKVKKICKAKVEINDL
jgi:FkbM family methyltransferase